MSLKILCTYVKLDIPIYITILISMNYTIYIASDLDKHDKFFGEENKSGLINQLLRQHYASTPSTPEAPKAIKTPADAKQAAKNVKPVTYTPKTNWGA